jgi:hypothetical protein
MASNLADLVKRLEVAVSAIEGLVGGPSGVPPASPAEKPSAAVPVSVTSPLLSAYDGTLMAKLGPLAELAAKIDPLVVNIVGLT